MAIGINQYQRPDKSPIERLAAALGIVQGIQGIRASNASIDKTNVEKQILEDQQNRIKDNVLTPKEQAEYLKEYKVTENQEPGSIGFKNPQGGNIFVSPKNKSADALNQEQYLSKITSGFKEVKPNTPGSQLVAHVDALGKTQLSYLLPPPKEDAKPEQYKAATFTRRLEQAESVFGDLQKNGFDPTSMSSGAQRVSLFGFGVPERLKDENVKRQEQAERNFVNALLRRESGSAISKSEFDSAEKQYFPRGGDTPEVLAQKTENRRIALEGMKNEAGPIAYNKLTPSAQGGLAKKGAPATGGGAKKKTGGSLIPTAVAGQSPRIGAVEDGYMYQGGDLADPKSWVKVK